MINARFFILKRDNAFINQMNNIFTCDKTDDFKDYKVKKYATIDEIADKIKALPNFISEEPNEHSALRAFLASTKNYPILLSDYLIAGDNKTTIAEFLDQVLPSKYLLYLTQDMDSSVKIENMILPFVGDKQYLITKRWIFNGLIYNPVEHCITVRYVA